MTHLVQPTRILVVGGGGREHALAWKLAAEPGVNEVVVAPGSDAIAREPRVRVVPGLDPLDPAAVVALARKRAIELVVIGPEAPLAAGVADALGTAGVPVFGPTAAAARIETSKTFCHEIAAEAGVPMANAATFRASDSAEARAWARDEADRAGSRGVVVKADGLAAGKGVVVCDTAAEAGAAIDALVAGGTERILVEERLTGPEATVIAICDGRYAVALPAARDHKRLGDGDTGPNTGGMGGYSPLPDLDDDAVAAILATVHEPILAALGRRLLDYRGFLYAGLMLTDDGPRLLECNARLGDPEAQVILPRLAGPLGPLLLTAARGRLESGARIPVLPGAAVGIVLAAAGYPAAPIRGVAIDGLAVNPDGLVFHAGTRRDGDGSWRVDGGRVLCVVGRGPDLAAARVIAEVAADSISWPGVQRRHDIGAAARPSEPVAAAR
ncbi:MAG TPA: phosphoribosylamine--glycine ligase [Candidatus Limnocylindrales bacterium]|nr:phosphoribosylamine--glycine ligase [Candidatus Limnocylindrales bacterium]